MRPPSAAERATIEALVPPALAHVKTWAPAVLNFGSDDALEYRVAGESGKRPTRADWTAFCEEVERRVLAIHSICPVTIFVKHDGGAYGRKLGPWHHWSLNQIATRFHELPLPPTAGPEIAAVCTSVLTMLEASGPATAALAPAARGKLVEWSAKVAASADPYAGYKLVDAVLALLPADEPLAPAVANALFCHATSKLVARLGGDDLVKRAAELLASVTPDNAEEILETLIDWMPLDHRAGLKVGEALLAAPSMKAIVETRSARVREGFASGRPTGEGSPSLTLASTADYLLETKRPKGALRYIKLGLRFPHPMPKLHGLRVRALHGAGFPLLAAKASKADVVAEAGLEAPEVFLHVARYCIELGKIDEAIDHVRRALGHKSGRWLYVQHNPRFAALRGRPEFDALFEPAH